MRQFHMQLSNSAPFSPPSEVRGLPARQGGGVRDQRPQFRREAQRDGVHWAGRVQPVWARPVHGHGHGAARPTGLGDHREAGPGRTSPPAGAVQGTFASNKNRRVGGDRRGRLLASRIYAFQSFSLQVLPNSIRFCRGSPLANWQKLLENITKKS